MQHGPSICKRTSLALSVAAMFATATGLAWAQDDDTITLGAAVSLTGKYSTNGKNTLDGYNLAVDRINEMGGVKVGAKTYKLKIAYYDDESTSARGAQLAERLISQDKIKFMLGPYSSGLTKAIAPVTEKYQVPMVEGNGADRDLFTQGYKWLFAVLSTSDYYLRDAVKLLAEQAKLQGRKPSDMKIAIAVENDNFSKDVRNGVEEDATKFGMKIVIDDKLPPELNDMAATLTKVKALRPDMLVVSGHEKGATLAVRQTADENVHVPMLALTHCDSAQIAEKLGKAAELAVCASQWDDSLQYKDKWFGTAKDYAERFRKAYNYRAPYQAAESSASVLVYADALGRAGSLDPQKVRDALAQTRITTFYGPIQFDATGKNTVKPMVLYQVQNGEYKIVAPAEWAQARFIYAAAGGKDAAPVVDRK
ncbi:amino acid/amide ABC transporter substrate-binding protein, HAAT family [Variovorax sp. HW608]|uniref:amino acid ABC transporter substrate-binding protein n=1 Tax=Variovorax sp. HW608 TaxID=1034889 RepID=UPI00081FCC44|nr:amino acid ABC transporter substrate-binding protein [Variovorax sp. HW608]SCK35293.1 amino acid/amide ABC transporter substrate-binding protein, HAAT family [Variovorax sp. HW608]